MNFRVSTIFGKNPFQELKIYGTNLREITTSVLSRKRIFKKKGTFKFSSYPWTSKLKFSCFPNVYRSARILET